MSSSNSVTNLTAEPTGQTSKAGVPALDTLVFSDSEALLITLNEVIKKSLPVDTRILFAVIDNRLYFDIDDQGATVSEWFKGLTEAAALNGY